jgi:hypothetical protein
MADANLAPFEQLAGMTLKLYIHGTASTAEPAASADPIASGFVFVGDTDGGQTVNHAGALTKFYDDNHQGVVKAVRPEEDPTITTMIVDLTLENYARVLNDAANVTSDAGPPAVKRMPIKRGRMPKLYTMLFRSEIASPYGSYPIQYYLPMAVFDGEPAPAFTKDGRAGLELVVTPFEDDTQAAGDELGWLTAQTG